MTIKRYARAPTLGLGFRFGTSFAIPVIRENIANGNIRFEELTFDENERLDILAGKFYGDARLGWIIAAASGIGWIAQVPPGTLIRVPNLDDTLRFVG